MLTDEQIKAIDVKTLGSLHFARAIEAETLKAHQQAIEAAVLAERKACADIVDNADTPDCGGWTAAGIAEAIRSRTQNMRTDHARHQCA